MVSKKLNNIKMKSIITTLFVFSATVCFSQKVDTVRNSIQIQPIVINPLKADTAYQLFWRVSVDRGGDNQGYGALFNRIGNRVHDFNFTVPQKVMNVWLDDKVIDTFLLNKFKLKYRL